MKRLLSSLFVVGLLFVSGCLNPHFATPIETHKASFLFDNGNTRVMNSLSIHISDAKFDDNINRCKANGDTVIYLFFSNERDGVGAPVSFYVNNQFGGTIDDNRIKQMTKRLEKCIDKDLLVVGWLFADDSPNISREGDIHGCVNEVRDTNDVVISRSTIDIRDTNIVAISRSPIAVQKKYIDNVDKYFGKYISEYVVALEADEHLDTARLIALSEHTAKYNKGKMWWGIVSFEKEIGMHQVPGKSNLALNIGPITVHYHQFGFNKSEAYIESQTRAIKAALAARGKKFIGAEYNLSSDTPKARSQGDAVMRGDGDGTGNGRNK